MAKEEGVALVRDSVLGAEAADSLRSRGRSHSPTAPDNILTPSAQSAGRVAYFGIAVTAVLLIAVVALRVDGTHFLRSPHEQKVVGFVDTEYLRQIEKHLGNVDEIEAARAASETDGGLGVDLHEQLRTQEKRSNVSSATMVLYKPNYAGEDGMWCTGVNVEGFKLDPAGGRKGRYETPSQEQLLYFHRMGANCFRLGVPWERLQAKLGDESLDPVAGLVEVVDFVTNHLGDHVIITPYNSFEGLKYNGTNAQKKDFVRLVMALARRWGGNEKVILGLYSGPLNGVDGDKEGVFDPDALDYDGSMIERWRDWVQEAIDAIRTLGVNNLILVPGLHGTSCFDWTGALWWGESLDDKKHAGNTRLAALNDTAMNLAYDVHQFMDLKFSGKLPGCSGHDARDLCDGQEDCFGADSGLTLTIAWAKQYKKRLMMTEMASLPGPDGTVPICKKKMQEFIQTMRLSGVFLGFQISQVGCADCPGDIWSQRPFNLDWYGFQEVHQSCTKTGQNCLTSKCCVDADKKCYQKNKYWAGCKTACSAGIDPLDRPAYRTSWTCEELKCSGPGEDCLSSMCCSRPDTRCYRKNASQAKCRRTCSPGEPWIMEEPGSRTPWNCSMLDGHVTPGFRFK